MKSIPSEFLGALFGAWIGLATKVWNRPFLEIAIFVLTIALIALCLSITTGTYATTIRVVALAFLFLLALCSGLVFAYFPGMSILQADQLTFYYVLLIVWLLIDTIAIPLESKLQDISVRLAPRSNEVRREG